MSNITTIDKIMPFHMCAECRVIAKMINDYLCQFCREDFEEKVRGLRK